VCLNALPTVGNFGCFIWKFISGFRVFALFALFVQWETLFRMDFRIGKWMLDFEPQRSTGAQLSSVPRLSPRQYYWTFGDLSGGAGLLLAL
jgi:hypothetical protein